MNMVGGGSSARVKSFNVQFSKTISTTLSVTVTSTDYTLTTFTSGSPDSSPFKTVVLKDGSLLVGKITEKTVNSHRQSAAITTSYGMFPSMSTVVSDLLAYLTPICQELKPTSSRPLKAYLKNFVSGDYYYQGFYYLKSISDSPETEINIYYENEELKADYMANNNDTTAYVYSNSSSTFTANFAVLYGRYLSALEYP